MMKTPANMKKGMMMALVALVSMAAHAQEKKVSSYGFSYGIGQYQ